MRQEEGYPGGVGVTPSDELESKCQFPFPLVFIDFLKLYMGFTVIVMELPFTPQDSLRRNEFIEEMHLCERCSC